MPYAHMGVKPGEKHSLDAEFVKQQFQIGTEKTAVSAFRHGIIAVARTEFGNNLRPFGARYSVVAPKFQSWSTPLIWASLQKITSTLFFLAASSNFFTFGTIASPLSHLRAPVTKSLSISTTSTAVFFISEILQNFFYCTLILLRAQAKNKVCFLLTTRFFFTIIPKRISEHH